MPLSSLSFQIPISSWTPIDVGVLKHGKRTSWLGHRIYFCNNEDGVQQTWTTFDYFPSRSADMKANEIESYFSVFGTERTTNFDTKTPSITTRKCWKFL